MSLSSWRNRAIHKERLSSSPSGYFVKFSQIELALSSGAAAEIEAAIKRAYVAGRLRNSNLVIGQTALEDLLVVMLASVISLRADPAEVNAAAARCSERPSALLELGRIERLDV